MPLSNPVLSGRNCFGRAKAESAPRGGPSALVCVAVLAFASLVGRPGWAREVGRMHEWGGAS